jgi:hypothetical protein
MTNIHRVRRRAAGGSAGAPGSLMNGELAYNEQDDYLYYGKGDAGGGVASSILPIGGPGAFISTVTSRAANTVLAGPAGSAGAPSFRALLSGDLPTVYIGTTAVPLSRSSGALSLSGVTIPGSGGVTSGTTTIDFGAFPGTHEASVVVTGLTGIVSGSVISVSFDGSATSGTHTPSDHRVADAFASLTYSQPSAGSGFTIYAVSIERLQGTFSLNWSFQ